MKEQEIDKSVRDLFLSQKLFAEKVQNILDQGNSQKTKKPVWKSYWMPVAAAIVIAFSFQFARNYQDEEFYFDFEYLLAQLLLRVHINQLYLSCTICRVKFINSSNFPRLETSNC